MLTENRNLPVSQVKQLISLELKQVRQLLSHYWQVLFVGSSQNLLDGQILKHVLFPENRNLPVPQVKQLIALEFKHEKQVILHY